MTAPTDLAALLASRICHDLISPLGAIGNGVELLRLEGYSDGPETSLISESVAAANARIRFFRVAFGVAATGQMVGRTEVLALLAGVFPERLRITWLPEAPVSRIEVRRAFLGLLCLQSALPGGGDLVVAGCALHWSLEARAARIKPVPGHWAMLDQPDTGAALGPAEVHFGLLRQDLLTGPGLATVARGDGLLNLTYAAAPT